MMINSQVRMYKERGHKNEVKSNAKSCSTFDIAGIHHYVRQHLRQLVSRYEDFNSYWSDHRYPSGPHGNVSLFSNWYHFHTTT